ncbi:VOC family protein [Streptomyces sp. NPDC058420]|uniref:VOC family protein n=1 Tax=Streptomyces sp. NPDC058420 TaxID=3346489 RepID=UPI00365830AF
MGGDRDAGGVRRPAPDALLQPQERAGTGSQLHIDINATDRYQDAEVERLLKLSARRADVGQTGEESWQVLADPEGNEFCLLKDRINPL